VARIDNFLFRQFCKWHNPTFTLISTKRTVLRLTISHLAQKKISFLLQTKWHAIPFGKQRVFYCRLYDITCDVWHKGMDQEIHSLHEVLTGKSEMGVIDEWLMRDWILVQIEWAGKSGTPLDSMNGNMMSAQNIAYNLSLKKHKIM